MRTVRPRCGATEASTRSPARSSPPGRPASSASNSRSSPLMPTGAPGGTPRRSSSAARSGGAGPTRPAISDASAPSSDSRASPSASGVPSRAWIAARGGSVVVRVSVSPRAQPGVDEIRPPVDRGAVLELHDRERDLARERAEDARAQHDRHRDRAAPRLAGAARAEPRQRRHLRRAAVGAGEPLERDAPLRLRGEQRAHRGVVAARPRVGERPRGRPARVLGAAADGRAGGERHDRRHDQRREPGPYRTAATLPRGRSGTGSGPARGAGGRRHRCAPILTRPCPR